jgi:hypothetical protein
MNVRNSMAKDKAKAGTDASSGSGLAMDKAPRLC